MILVLLLLSSFSLSASDKPTGKFEPGSFIIEHVSDAHSWHILTYKEHDVSIPLPVILYDDGKVICFLSSKFEHGHAAYRGYALGFTRETKGKIVKLTGKHAGYSGELHDKEALSESVDIENMPIDFSITKNVVSLFVSIFLMIWIFLYVAKQYKNRPNKAPHGLQSFIEMIIVFVRDEIARPSIGETRYVKYLPYLLTLFFFILLNNLMGLIPFFPGGANLTGNLAVTGILALITFILTLCSSNKGYWKHTFNTPGAPWWLKIPVPLLPTIELVGVLTKPVVLAIRLFANILGGHIIVIGIISLIFIMGQNVAPAAGYGFSIVSIFFYLFMGLLEMIVAFVQSLVFTLLSAMYIGMAREESHEDNHIETEGHSATSLSTEL
jgi:F-type H+-transporting ATPase subunit a